MPHSDDWLYELCFIFQQFQSNHLVLVGEGKCFFTEESYLINVEGVIELENHICNLC